MNKETQLKILERIGYHFKLNDDQLFKMISHINIGDMLVAAGIATWYPKPNGVQRSVHQLQLAGLKIIGDESFVYKELMYTLGEVEADLSKTFDYQDFDRCLYIYTINPTLGKLQTHFFSVTKVDVGA